MRKKIILSFISLFAGYVCAQNAPYCLENDIIHSYLNDFSYDSIPLDTSFVMAYFDKGKDEGYRMDAPKPINLSWTHDPSAQAQRIEVSESSTYANPLVYSVAPDKDSYDLYNLIPGKNYYYKIISTDASSNETVVVAGQFETSGSLRMILGEGTWNVRDMGGWISSLTGKPIAYGKIYRGAQLKAKGKDSVLLTTEGIEAMRRVGIRAELDLRSRDNCPVDGSALAKKDDNGNDDVDFLLLPESVNARMLNYDNNDANIRELKWIISELKQNKPVYFHCQNGADRTGTLGFLIGALLGMNESDLAKDYELTTFCEPYAAAYDPTEVGFARLRDYTGKKGSALTSGDNGDEYMYAKLVEKMRTVAPVNGTYQEKIYNFFRTGVGGNKVSAADLSWFIMEMTGYPFLGGLNADVDTIRLEIGDTQKINVSVFPEGAAYSKITFKSTSSDIATVTDDGVVRAVGAGSAYIIVDVDGIDKFIPVIVPITEETVSGISLENDYVSRYMNETDYQGDDAYSLSYISNYVPDTRQDWPQSITIKWSKIDGVTDQNLVVSEREDFGTSIVNVNLDNNESSYKIDKDLSPGKIYYYKITGTYSGNDNIILLSSGFKLAGIVRMIKVRNAFNIRDLGGWTGLGGHKVKYNVIFRGSRLRNNKDNGGALMITTEEVSYLKGLGINAELDFRSDDETSDSKPALNFKSKIYLRANTASSCQGANILSGDAYIKALSTVIGWLRKDKVIYMSGTYGAERTGTMAFLINGLLGVDEDGLSKDYELSSFSGDNLSKVVCERNSGDFPAMVSKLKTLDGETLQQKIYNYFKDGVNGTSISSEDLDWFICYMLDIDEKELNDIKLNVDAAKIKATGSTKIFNASGQEITAPVPGINIVGDKIIYLTK